jgi:hypothetical protein
MPRIRDESRAKKLPPPRDELIPKTSQSFSAKPNGAKTNTVQGGAFAGWRTPALRFCDH